jgi:cyanate lyase
MNKQSATEAVLAAKEEKGLTFARIAEAVGRSPVWTTSAILGQQQMSDKEAAEVVALLDLPAGVATALRRFPDKGSLPGPVPTDPLIYRFHEIVQVYGTTLKALIHEEFGDGIMSAIDFEMDIERVPDPKGDRVKVTLNGKFLPYRKW